MDREAEGPILVRCFAGGAPLGVAEPLAVRRPPEIRVERSGRCILRPLPGLRLNGAPVACDHVLAPGDVIRLGDALDVFAHGEAGPAASQAGVAVERSIGAVAARRHSVVLTGETGTGKEVVARALHERSGRPGPFVAVNCSTFTESLLPSELFGHVRGAFTGAVADHPGLFRAAHGGTLLLDELGDLPGGLQASLLRVLETREVRPVGGLREVPVDVRVIATVAGELYDLVRAGRFRADLYSRLAQWTIRLPRLAERREDLPALTASLLPRVEGEGRTLSPDLAEALLIHDWPLNIRGLLNVLSIAVISSPDDGPLVLGSEVRTALWTTRSLAPESSPRAEPGRTTLDRRELEELMLQFHGHVAAAGRHVGMTRSKLYRLLEAHGLDPDDFREHISSFRADHARTTGFVSTAG